MSGASSASRRIRDLGHRGVDAAVQQLLPPPRSRQPLDKRAVGLRLGCGQRLVAVIDAIRPCGYDSGMVSVWCSRPCGSALLSIMVGSWAKEVLMKPMLIVMRHVPVVALLAGAVVLAGLAPALPVLAALAPPEADADQTP